MQFEAVSLFTAHKMKTINSVFIYCLSWFCDIMSILGDVDVLLKYDWSPFCPHYFYILVSLSHPLFLTVLCCDVHCLFDISVSIVDYFVIWCAL